MTFLPHIRTMLLTGAIVATTCLSGVSALAGDVVLGIGRDNIDASRGDEANTLQLEYHSAPLRSYDWGGLSWMGVIEADSDSDLYAGAGLSLIWNLSGAFFVEGSLAAGYYSAGSDGLDLGSDMLFRSLAGVGYRLNDVTAISLSLDHLSNAGLESPNPGRNAVHLRYRRSF